MLIENPVFLWIVVGSISGLVFGLAGSGGGAISIPLLMTFGGYDIKDASGYGLLALMVGAAISWFLQRENTIYPLAIVLILCAGLIAYISAPLKAMAPDWLVTLLLNITFFFGLYSLWILRKPDDPGEIKPLSYRMKTVTVGGMMTGLLTTMTGLGGGVLMIPWLTGVTRLKFDQALACSLLTVAATAPFSAWRQGRVDLFPAEWFGLIGSILITGILAKSLCNRLPSAKLVVLRKLALTTIILLSMIRTITAVV